MRTPGSPCVVRGMRRHQPDRPAYRTGHATSEAVLGGRKVAIRRPRVRCAGRLGFARVDDQPPVLDVVAQGRTCVATDKGYDIISGHHHIRAARKAGMKEMLVLVHTHLDLASVVAKQLAHNTISGKDDPELVKRLFDEITQLPEKIEAFGDPKVFDAIPKVVPFTPVDVGMLDQLTHLDYYRDEFTFRFNRRRSRHRGKRFFRLVQQAVATEPIPYHRIVKRTRHGRRRDHQDIGVT